MIEVRLNADGSLDEVVGVGRFHLEQMDTGHWWVGFGNGPLLHVNLHARGKITAGVIDERHPADRVAAEVEVDENRDLWEYVLAMEACNIAMDEGRAPLTSELARLNAAQVVLKERYDRQRIVRRPSDSAS